MKVVECLSFEFVLELHYSSVFRGTAGFRCTISNDLDSPLSPKLCDRVPATSSKFKSSVGQLVASFSSVTLLTDLYELIFPGI